MMSRARKERQRTGTVEENLPAHQGQPNTLGTSSDVVPSLQGGLILQQSRFGCSESGVWQSQKPQLEVGNVIKGHEPLCELSGLQRTKCGWFWIMSTKSYAPSDTVRVPWRFGHQHPTCMHHTDIKDHKRTDDLEWCMVFIKSFLSFLFLETR